MNTNRVMNWIFEDGYIIDKDHPSHAEPIVATIFNSSHFSQDEKAEHAGLIVSAPLLMSELEKACNVIAHCISEMPEAYREAMRAQLKSGRAAIIKAAAVPI